MAVRQFELAAKNKSEKIACLEARKHYAWYLKGVPYAGYWKSEISKITTLEDVYRVTAGIQRELKDPPSLDDRRFILSNASEESLSVVFVPQETERGGKAALLRG